MALKKKIAQNLDMGSNYADLLTASQSTAPHGNGYKKQGAVNLPRRTCAAKNNSLVTST
jgi:hypothetical protein